MTTISETAINNAARDLWEIGHHATARQLSDVRGCDLPTAQRMIAQLRSMGRLRDEPWNNRNQRFYTVLQHPEKGWQEPPHDARGDRVKPRTCLMCREDFESESPANRRCPECVTRLSTAKDMPVDAPGWEYVTA